ncbi:MAG: type II secretion system protein GspE, partial [Gemmatimonadaceae bacterium]
MTAPAIIAEKIGDLLVREGLITRDQLNLALQEQRENGTRIGYNLVALGYIKETDLTRMLARQYRMPAVDLSNFEVDPKIARLIPNEMATKHLVLPLKRDGRTLTVAMADPTGASLLEDLKFITRCDIFPVIAGEYTLRNAIERYFESNEAQMESLLKDITKLNEGDVELVEQIDEDMTAAAMAIAVQDAPVVKLINALLTDAVARGAS